MPVDRIRVEYALLQSYIGWTDSDAARVHHARQYLLADSDAMVEDFYAEILRHPQTASIIAGGERQVERLKGSLRKWIADLCEGPYDASYVERRWLIGKRHVDIGVGPMFVIAAFARLRWRMIDSLRRHWTETPEDLAETILSLNRLLDLDLSIIQDSYEIENSSRSAPIDENGIRKHRVLAEIGERALGGIDIHDLFDQVVIHVAEGFAADRCELWESTEDRTRLTLRSGFRWPVSEIGHRMIPIEPGNEFDFVRDHRRAISTPDWNIEKRFKKSNDVELEPMASSLWVRLSADSQLFGILAVHFKGKRSFSHADYDFLQSVSNVLSTAIVRQAELERRTENERRLRRLVDQLPAGALFLSQGQIVVNRSFEEMTGFDRGELTTIEDWQRILLRQDEKSPLPDDLSIDDKGLVTHRSALIRRKDGQERLLDIAAFRSLADEVWLIHDVTEAEYRHERSLRAERLAAIGQMITGLAHESRNALQRIRACTEMLEFDLESNPPAMELLGRLGKAQDDLRRLFDEVRGYASPIALERQHCQIKSMVDEAWDACEHLRVGRIAHLEMKAGNVSVRDLWVDRFRIVQVFRNIFENALAACTDPVRIEVACHETILDESPFEEIRVSDNGPGINSKDKARLFEPFFTTKAKGTGLGMAIAQRIVELHGGRISTGESMGQGAEFIIALPRASR